MDNLTKNQLIMLVLLVSFVTSLVTGIVTVSLVNQAPAPFTQTINRVIEKIVPTGNGQQQAASLPTPLTREESIVKVVKDVSSSVVSVVATKDLPVIEEYFINPFPDLFPDVQIPQYRQKGTEKKPNTSGIGQRRPLLPKRNSASGPRMNAKGPSMKAMWEELASRRV